MEVVLKRMGNSSTLVMPPPLLKNLGIGVGQRVTLATTADGKIVLTLSSKQNSEGQLHNQKSFYFANAGRRQGPWMLSRNKTDLGCFMRLRRMTARR